MYGRKRIDAFDFHDDRSGNQQINSVTGIQSCTFVSNWQSHLPADIDAAEHQLMSEAVLVSRFKQACAQSSMYMQPRVYRLLAYQLSLGRNGMVHLCALRALGVKYPSRMEPPNGKLSRYFVGNGPEWESLRFCADAGFAAGDEAADVFAMGDENENSEKQSEHRV